MIVIANYLDTLLVSLLMTSNLAITLPRLTVYRGRYVLITISNPQSIHPSIVACINNKIRLCMITIIKKKQKDYVKNEYNFTKGT